MAASRFIQGQVSGFNLALGHRAPQGSFGFAAKGAQPLTEQLEETIEAPTDGPEVVIERKQIGALLGDCLPKLSVIHSEIVDLVYYHEKSIEEVAEILQIPIGTVKTRMFNTRKSLAGMLAGKIKAAGAILS